MNTIELKNWANDILTKAGISTKNEKARVEQVNAALSVVETMPDEIADLMRTTIENSVNQLVKADARIEQIWEIDREDREAVNREGHMKYNNGDKEGARKLWDFERSMGHDEYMVTKGSFKNRADLISTYGLARIERWEELGDLYKIVGGRTTAGNEGYAKCLKKVAMSMADIANDLTEKLGGVPEGCETDAHWGVGGYFNAIIFRGEKRVSFKSFLAGGWNIQRLHIRAKATLLK